MIEQLEITKDGNHSAARSAGLDVSYDARVFLRYLHDNGYRIAHLVAAAPAQTHADGTR